MDVTLLYIHWDALRGEYVHCACAGPSHFKPCFWTSLTDIAHLITPSQENKAQTMTGGGGFEIRQGL